MEVLIPYLPGLVLLLAIAGINRMAFIYLVNRRFHLSFSRNPMVILLYFILMTGIVSAIFFPYAATLYGNAPAGAVILLAFVLLVINPWIYRRLREAHKVPTWLAEQNPDQQFLRIDEQYLFSKTGDIVFQQTVIGIVLLTLAEAGVPLSELVLIFAGVFALGHVHMFFSATPLWGTYFTLFAAGAGFALPFIVLTVPGGVYYAIALHMFWYVASGAFFGILLSDLTELSIGRRHRRGKTR